jgi:uncharacterized lipoprotein YajG
MTVVNQETHDADLLRSDLVSDLVRRRSALTGIVKSVSRALLVLSITSAAGCYPPESVAIGYVPAANTMPLSGASSERVFVVGEDQRANKTTVGQFQAGYSQVAIVTSNDVADAARNAVQEELAARGFVIGAGATSSEVRVQVLRFRSYLINSLFTANYSAELIMHVQVERPGKAIAYSQSFDVTETVHPSVFGHSMSDGFREALDAALKKGVTQLFDDSSFKDALVPKPSQPTANSQIPGVKK